MLGPPRAALVALGDPAGLAQAQRRLGGVGQEVGDGRGARQNVGEAGVGVAGQQGRHAAEAVLRMAALRRDLAAGSEASRAS